MDITIVTQDEEVNQILNIQSANHKKTLSQLSSDTNGFVTVQHSFKTLKELSLKAPQVIAKADDRVIAYALAMPKECKNLIPVLVPMFNSFDHTTINNHRLSDLNYYVMGQICVADEYKRQGIFSKLYLKQKELLQNTYNYCVTEVSVRNIPSIKAHKKLGFKTVHTQEDESDTWEILLWDWC